MSTEYSDNPFPRRKRITTAPPPDAPHCRCGSKPQLYKETFKRRKGFVVLCSDPYCPLEELPLAESEACPTESGAWHFWSWKRTGRL